MPGGFIIIVLLAFFSWRPSVSVLAQVCKSEDGETPCGSMPGTTTPGGGSIPGRQQDPAGAQEQYNGTTTIQLNKDPWDDAPVKVRA